MTGTRNVLGAAQRVSDYLDGLVTAGRIAGWSWAMHSVGHVPFRAEGGLRDLARGLSIEASTLFRIYSMTKPVTAVAAAILRERGQLDLAAPLHAFLPEFAATEVYVRGEGDSIRTRPPRSPITVLQAVSHTAGLTYGFHRSHPVDALYRAAGHDVEAPPGATLEEACRFWASCPLLFEPGSAWNYSVGLDVVGRVVEVVSGMRLGEFFREEIFEPLGMADTTFYVGEDRKGDLATMYAVADAGLVENTEVGRNVHIPTAGHFGGGGLVSTRDDFGRFVQMLLDRGAGPGGRVLARESVDLLLRNHLPDGADIATFGRSMRSELGFIGSGQALGGTVQLHASGDPAPRSAGEYGWGGMASTYFWASPADGVGAVFMLQALPAASLPIRAKLHQLVHEAVLQLLP